MKSVRASDADLTGDDVLALVTDNTGIARRLLDVAVAYYSDYPDEVDSLIAEADAAEESVEHSVGTPDTEVLELAAAQGRILVTDNIRDFVPLSNAWAAQGRTHPGVLLVSSRTFPMTSKRTGSIAAAPVVRHSAGTWPAAGQCDFLT